ncbi:MAG TPA: hypothetical protein VG713_07590, partial [Pirellulales bacterium]|nr:hypothetical protein [Pirellulales bacterium]
MPIQIAWGAIGTLFVWGCASVSVGAALRALPADGEGAQAKVDAIVLAIVVEQAGTCLLAAGSIAVSSFWPMVPKVFAGAILFWMLALASETVLRAAFAYSAGVRVRDALTSSLVLRSIVRSLLWRSHQHEETNQGSPPIDAVVHRWLPKAASGLSLMALAIWATSGIVVIAPEEVGSYVRLGFYIDDPLLPGLHFTLPYPLGSVRRVAVKRINAMPIGFAVNDKSLFAAPLLWSKPHGDEEFPLLVGSGAEAVIVNGLVRYCVDERPAALRYYSTRAESPELTLRALAHQALFTELRGMSLDDALVSGRAELPDRLQRRLCDLVERNQ